jgi:hypothetical protein
MLAKLMAASINLPSSLDKQSQKQIVLDYFQTTNMVMDMERRLEQIYSDPNIKDKQAAHHSTDLRIT